jgi:hypothetical protein
METRYLYVDGVFKDPIASEEEEEKQERKGGNSVAAIDGDVPDDKSDVSALTNKTTMTQRGKHADKHCPLCDFKLVPGKNWSRHCKGFHDDTKVEGLKCGLDCHQCKSKYHFRASHCGKSASLVEKLPNNVVIFLITSFLGATKLLSQSMTKRANTGDTKRLLAKIVATKERLVTRRAVRALCVQR